MRRELRDMSDNVALRDMIVQRRDELLSLQQRDIHAAFLNRQYLEDVVELQARQLRTARDQMRSKEAALDAIASERQALLNALQQTHGIRDALLRQRAEESIKAAHDTAARLKEEVSTALALSSASAATLAAIESGSKDAVLSTIPSTTAMGDDIDAPLKALQSDDPQARKQALFMLAHASLKPLGKSTVPSAQAVQNPTTSTKPRPETTTTTGRKPSMVTTNRPQSAALKSPTRPRRSATLSSPLKAPSVTPVKQRKPPLPTEAKSPQPSTVGASQTQSQAGPQKLLGRSQLGPERHDPTAERSETDQSPAARRRSSSSRPSAFPEEHLTHLEEQDRGTSTTQSLELQRQSEFNTLESSDEVVNPACSEFAGSSPGGSTQKRSKDTAPNPVWSVRDNPESNIPIPFLHPNYTRAHGAPDRVGEDNPYSLRSPSVPSTIFPSHTHTHLFETPQNARIRGEYLGTPSPIATAAAAAAVAAPASDWEAEERLIEGCRTAVTELARSVDMKSAEFPDEPRAARGVAPLGLQSSLESKLAVPFREPRLYASRVPNYLTTDDEMSAGFEDEDDQNDDDEEENDDSTTGGSSSGGAPSRKKPKYRPNEVEIKRVLAELGLGDPGEGDKSSNKLSLNSAIPPAVVELMREYATAELRLGRRPKRTIEFITSLNALWIQHLQELRQIQRMTHEKEIAVWRRRLANSIPYTALVHGAKGNSDAKTKKRAPRHPAARVRVCHCQCGCVGESVDNEGKGVCKHCSGEKVAYALPRCATSPSPYRHLHHHPGVSGGSAASSSGQSAGDAPGCHVTTCDKPVCVPIVYPQSLDHLLGCHKPKSRATSRPRDKDIEPMHGVRLALSDRGMAFTKAQETSTEPTSPTSYPTADTDYEGTIRAQTQVHREGVARSGAVNAVPALPPPMPAQSFESKGESLPPQAQAASNSSVSSQAASKPQPQLESGAEVKLPEDTRARRPWHTTPKTDTLANQRITVSQSETSAQVTLSVVQSLSKRCIRLESELEDARRIVRGAVLLWLFSFSVPKFALHCSPPHILLVPRHVHPLDCEHRQAPRRRA